MYVPKTHAETRLDVLAHLLADQRAAERRIVGDAAVAGVGLGLADDLVALRLVVVVEHGDGRAEHDLVARERGRIDDLRAGHPILDLGDLRLDLALPLLGGMVLGVFG